MATVANQANILDTDDKYIGGMFVGLVFMGITAAIYTFVIQNTDLVEADEFVWVRQILWGAMFLFLLAIFANYKALDILQDHAYTLLKIAFWSGIVLFAGVFGLIGALLFSTNSTLGMFIIGIGALILMLFIFFWNRIQSRIEMAAEWLTIAATVVLNEPGMIVISFVQSLVVGITIITEALSIYTFINYANASGMDQDTYNLIYNAIIFGYLWLSLTVIYFFDGANSVIAYARIKGVDPKIGQGLQASFRKLGSIMGFALISAIVYFITNYLRRLGASRMSGSSTGKRSSGNISGAQIAGFFLALLASVAEWLYYYISFFTLPIITIRKKGTVNAMRESYHHFRQRLWDVVIGDMAYGWGASIMYAISGLILAVFGFLYGYYVAGGEYAIIVGIVVAILALIFGLMITKFFLRPLYTSFVTVIYTYASEGPDGLVIVPDRLKQHIGSTMQNPRAQPRQQSNQLL